MAKQPAKTKPAKAAVAADDLSVALYELALLDEEVAAALRLMWIGIMAPIAKPFLKQNQFQLGSTTYSAMLTAYQWDTILGVVAKNGNVLGTVLSLLSDMTKAMSGCACSLMDQLNGASHMLRAQASPMGCCTLDGGQKKPLTQAQCNQYAGSAWDGSDPTCTRDTR